MQESKAEWYFIVNPRAGSGKTMSEWVPAEKKLDKLGVPFITEFTDHKRHATSLAYNAADMGYRKILAVGGDGSLHEVFNGIMKWCDEKDIDPSEFLLGVVPIGSGNDWIKSLNVPCESSTVIDLLAKESFGQIDVVRVKSVGGKVRYLANGFGTGFDSHVCKRVNMLKESGFRSKMIYLNALRHTILHLKPISILVNVDGKEFFNGRAWSIAIGNGRYSGSGMRQVPLALPDDGYIDLMIVPEVSITTIFRQIPRLFNGTLNESKEVLMTRCKSITIAPMDQTSQDIIEIDGEIEGRLPVTVEITGQKISVIKG